MRFAPIWSSETWVPVMVPPLTSPATWSLSRAGPLVRNQEDTERLLGCVGFPGGHQKNWRQLMKGKSLGKHEGSQVGELGAETRWLGNERQTEEDRENVLEALVIIRLF